MLPSQLSRLEGAARGGLLKTCGQGSGGFPPRMLHKLPPLNKGGAGGPSRRPRTESRSIAPLRLLFILVLRLVLVFKLLVRPSARRGRAFRRPPSLKAVAQQKTPNRPPRNSPIQPTFSSAQGQGRFIQAAVDGCRAILIVIIMHPSTNRFSPRSSFHDRSKNPCAPRFFRSFRWPPSWRSRLGGPRGLPWPRNPARRRARRRWRASCGRRRISTKKPSRSRWS